MPSLSPRIQLFADFLIPNEPVWDFCCDHGYLGIWAGLSGAFPEVHFVDRVPQIIQKLKHDIQRERYPMPDKPLFYFWPQDGGSIPQVVEGTVVIAGVGAFPLMQILEKLISTDKLQAKRLILSPHSSIERMTSAITQESGQFFGKYYLETQLIAPDRNTPRKVWIFDRTYKEPQN